MANGQTPLIRAVADEVAATGHCTPSAALHQVCKEVLLSRDALTPALASSLREKLLQRAIGGRRGGFVAAAEELAIDEDPRHRAAARHVLERVLVLLAVVLPVELHVAGLVSGE